MSRTCSFIITTSLLIAEHRSAGLLAGLEVLLEQREFAQAGLGQQLVLDLMGGGGRERHEHCAGRVRPRGQVEDADDRPPSGMVNRGSRTGELTQLVGVVLASVDQRLLSTGDGGANAVRARELLGVAVPGREGHRSRAARSARGWSSADRVRRQRGR